MASKSFELFETSSAAAKAEAISTNPRLNEDHSPDMEDPAQHQEKEVKYIARFKAVYRPLWHDSCRVSGHAEPDDYVNCYSKD